jgi:hypothetical protein
LTLLALTLFPVSLAQVTYRGEVTFATDAILSEAFPAQVGWSLAGHIDSEYRQDPLTLRLVLDPSLRFAPEGALDLGLTELYARLPLGDLEVSAGLERFPLEYARLSLPYGIESMSASGVRRGVPGVRVVWFPDDWRLRAGVLLVNERVTPLISVKRGFGDFELEAHVLYAESAVLGLGGQWRAGRRGAVRRGVAFDRTFRCTWRARRDGIHGRFPLDAGGCVRAQSRLPRGASATPGTVFPAARQ